VFRLPYASAKVSSVIKGPSHRARVTLFSSTAVVDCFTHWQVTSVLPV
jgi:hypothetical protein